ncbi:MAG TPA: C25 family cysteine peptidase [Chitinophagaceae bacterium]|nr:C25 family cysteine peptidase [Chitinophagaceae bacterium]
MKRILCCLMMLACIVAKSQSYNNEWIDHSKTYYKFKIGKTGVFRINQPSLLAASINVTAAEDFQVWRNGVQIPIYTSVVTGSLSASDYIEFWGEMNDGKADKGLYRDPEFQLNDKWSLETDTSAYFLTLSRGTANRRLVQSANNIAGNTLAPEPYFMHTRGNYFRDRINSGYAVSVDNQYLLSSSYDKGEGWSSGDLGTNGVYTNTFTDLQVYAAGPAAKFNIAVSGNSVNARNYRVNINNDSIVGGDVDYFNDAKGVANFPVSLIATNVAKVDVLNTVDRMVIHKYEITYPRQFHFGNTSNFEFSLPSTNSGNYLEITGFVYGATAPILYDLTSGRRYIADITGVPLIKFALPPSSVERKLVLVSAESANVNFVSEFTVRNFRDYRASANQGDYMIISNDLLTRGANGVNPLDEYKNYRAGTAGGGYNAKVYFADELIDQFAYGVHLSPLGIKNFIRFARRNFSTLPKHAFIIGKGVEYTTQRYNDNADVRRLNLVPTYGYPGSDILLSSEIGTSLPLTPIGRLSVVHPQEVLDYLAKIKQHDLAQATFSANMEDRGWMKNVAHLVGATEPELKRKLEKNMDDFKVIIADTLYGANVSTFSNNTSNTVGQLENSEFKKLIENGLSIITYFGHSSTGTLQYNIDEPQNYNSTGKYPLFIALGCSAGNFFGADNIRLTKTDGLSEKYVLAPQKGMIGFIASTHFGIVHYLNIWNARMYESLGNTEYGKTVGEAIVSTASKVFNYTSEQDFYSRANVEQLEYHGDPAIKVNPHPKPDYLVTDPLVKITPAFISVAERSFKVDARFYNIGKAVNDKIRIEIKRQYPDNSSKVIYTDTINGIRYTHAISVDIPIEPNADKGSNKITITVDADNKINEQYETNNSITKEFLIFEDEARPVYPYNFGIVNQTNTKLTFSTANPFSESKQYKVEVDTTELFNSGFKISKTITSKGGVVEVDPGFTFVDKTVYYWRVSILPTSGEMKWNSSSFVYLQNHDLGFNQSHPFQHFKSGFKNVYIDSTSRQWKFTAAIPTNILAKTGTFPRAAESQTSVAINGDASFIRSACWYSSIIFNVFDGNSNKPMVNQTIRNGGAWPNVGEGLYGSSANSCGFSRRLHFEFQYGDTASRRKMMDFMRNAIPDGAYVIVRSFALEDYWGRPRVFANDWANDTLYYGAGNSFYHSLKNAGFAEVDSFNRLRQFQFAYKKNDPSFAPRWVLTRGVTDLETLSFDMGRTDTVGSFTSPAFGPVKKWKQLLWNGVSLESPTGDNPKINVIGVKKDNTESILFSNIGLNQKSLDISSIDPEIYAGVKLQMHNFDSTNYTPYQLDYWRLTNDPVPEGGVAPNVFFKMSDTVQGGQPLEFQLAFKNVSPAGFDSLKVKIVLTDKNNVQHILPQVKYRPLSANDTIHVRQTLDTRAFSGMNSLFVEVNPENDQPEQFSFNNFAFSKFYVAGDSLKPLMDVTFDNIHILNNDIVSSRPEIFIKLQDESKWLLLKDTSLVKVKVRYPDNRLVSFNFNSDTLRFNAAQSSADNTATINFKPFFDEDGNYELIVSGKDESENAAGSFDYKVAFQVINKAMISNLLNYPNPFTTSTAFVFTLTGHEVPQNIKIQILTVTGKVVREITKQELGPLRIGRNITEFKWDGTDQYGQKLGNGIYLYRVITNLNGKSLDKYKSESDDTDKYFNKGYGKMYLMR